MIKNKLSIPEQRENNKRWYCAPFAVSSITGACFTQVRSTINTVAGRKPNQGICGVSEWNVCKALQELGFWTQLAYNWVDSDYRQKITFKEWLRRDRDDSFHLVVLTDHYVVVKGGQFIDNHSKHILGVNYAPWQRKRVLAVYRVGQ